MSKTKSPRSILVTGASSGIGAAVAAQRVRRGDRVFGTSRRAHATGEGGIHWLAMDVCHEASVEAGVDDAYTHAGGIDAAVLCAGYGIFGSVEDVSIEAAMAQFDTNYFGVLRCLRALLPRMRSQGHGRILVVGSLAGRVPIPFQSHYSASKAALDATVLALHNELLGHDIHVSLIEPGDISTPFNDAMDWSTSPGESAYADQLHRCERVIRESLPKAPGVEVVVRAVDAALDAGSPRLRYAVGAEVPVVPLAKRLMPDGWAARLIASHFGLR
jgi:NAD(P)-dependent dehydrogenase (short-subunit alcohol dehydrogenase family)